MSLLQKTAVNYDKHVYKYYIGFADGLQILYKHGLGHVFGSSPKTIISIFRV